MAVRGSRTDRTLGPVEGSRRGSALTLYGAPRSPRGFSLPANAERQKQDPVHCPRRSVTSDGGLTGRGLPAIRSLTLSPETTCPQATSVRQSRRLGSGEVGELQLHSFGQPPRKPSRATYIQKQNESTLPEHRAPPSVIGATARVTDEGQCPTHNPSHRGALVAAPRRASFAALQRMVSDPSASCSNACAAAASAPSSGLSLGKRWPSQGRLATRPNGPCSHS